MIRLPSAASPTATETLTHHVVSVTGVDERGTSVMCRDAYGAEFLIDATTRAKGVGLPTAGETWLIQRVGGSWLLHSMVGAPAPVTVQGSVTDPVVGKILDALLAAGLVVDETTRPPSPPPPGPATDPAPDPDPSMATYQDLGFEGAALRVAPASTDPQDADIDDVEPASQRTERAVTLTTYRPDVTLGTQRLLADFRRLKAQSDIIALHGVMHSTHLAATGMDLVGGGWDSFYPEDHAPSHPVMWRASVFTRVGAGETELLEVDGPGLPSRGMSWVRLVHVPTGLRMRVMSMEMENGAAYAGEFDATRTTTAASHVERFATQMGALHEWLRTHPVSEPTLLVGRFGVSAIDDLRKREEAMPTRRMLSLGYTSNWATLGAPTSGTTKQEEATLDWHFHHPGEIARTRITRSRVLTGYHSDSRPVQSTITLSS